MEPSAFANLTLGSPEVVGLLAGAAIGILFFLFVLILAVYIYVSLAFMQIARKTKVHPAGIAWIPWIGPRIITYKNSHMHWWPWLLLIALPIPVLGPIAMIIFYAFSIVWLWKTFEALNYPGWWAILCIIPVVNLILIGIAAWSQQPPRTRRKR